MNDVPTLTLSLLVAVSANGVIGNQKQLPWHLPDELAYFKQCTMGHTLIMGRATYQSIPVPLVGRSCIVLSRSEQFCLEPSMSAYPYCIAHSFADALRCIAEHPHIFSSKVFVIGGAEVFRAALPSVQRLHYTHIHATVEGDTLMPEIDWHEWRKCSHIYHGRDARHAHSYDVCVYERVGV